MMRSPYSSKLEILKNGCQINTTLSAWRMRLLKVPSRQHIHHFLTFDVPRRLVSIEEKNSINIYLMKIIDQS
ncbi:unnamed protein product [Acanthoscelides obtectus]|uniref:Uncharacterized protein n=1 Tax=Acanthoscelides obtectus TaxID=200917 RepID=A0A9P0NWV5_ACAOB|nr:unnamed protein product [Acanthoscelides obtectus]CAK1646980.1 hypothetical protein AOBTE_LOCUS14984 [Acanthoscelides obtectus]